MIYTVKFTSAFNRGYKLICLKIKGRLPYFLLYGNRLFSVYFRHYQPFVIQESLCQIEIRSSRLWLVDNDLVRYGSGLAAEQIYPVGEQYRLVDIVGDEQR